MRTTCMKRVTIICDGALELNIEKEIHELGATGYTCSHVHGAGAKGIRPDRWHGPNLRIEIVASPELADRILEHISKKYFERYGVIALLDDVGAFVKRNSGLASEDNLPCEGVRTSSRD